MSDIYVPIDFSEVKTVIPSGVDIIYSTLMQAEFTFANTRTRFISHVIITQNGFAWSKPVKHKAPELKFTPWNDVNLINRDAIIVGLTDHFRIIRAEQFESKDKFNQRKKEFGLKILPYVINYKSQWLSEHENNLRNIASRHHQKSLLKNQRIYEKLKRKAGN